MQKKVIFGSLFVILAFAFMFADAQYHIGFKDKPSMALTHAAHGNMAGMDHSSMDIGGMDHSSMGSMDQSHENTGEHDNSDGHHDVDMSAMEGMDHSSMDMSSMTPLEDLPLEEPQTTLEPLIIRENGKEIKVFNMWIEAIKKEIRPGVYTEGWGFNRQIPGPELRIKEGDNVRVIFENKHTVEHTIHWHGVHVSTEMDGVPKISQEPVKPNETFTYDFVAGPSGTHMYHCHVDTDHHVDMGMYGPFIIEAKDENLAIYDKEITWMLSSFNTKDHHHVEGTSEYFSGHHQYKAEKDAFLINGKAFPATEPLIVKNGDLIKLRMINIGKEPYSMHIHGHSFIATHKDGFPIKDPPEMDTLPILPGERYDLKIKMNNPGAWVFHDHITQHVTNDGFYPGGMLALILYEGYKLPDFTKRFLEKIDKYNIQALKLGRLPEIGSTSVETHSGGHDGTMPVHDNSDGHHDMDEASQGASNHDDGHDHSPESSGKHGHINSFGPGEAPHMHNVDLTKLEYVHDIARDPDEVPAPIERDYEDTVKFTLIAKEVIAEIAPGINYTYWTFNDKIPGPMLRVREGDTVEVTLINHESSTHNHSIDLHAVTGGLGGGASTQVAPGDSKTIRFKALNPGSYIYHCATHNVPMHMTNGMYGMILVEPKDGLKTVDKEFYVMQGELYTKGAIGQKGHQEFDPKKMLYENPEYVIFNGRVKSLVDHPLKAKVGDNIRLYVGNGGVSLISSFHIIGEIFDKVYPEGSTSILENIQTTAIPAGGATVTEFGLEVPGDYVLVDHALSRLDKGAWGLLSVEGPENPDVYSELKK